MSGPYVWQRAFWSEAGDGFRDGWVIGATVGFGLVIGVSAVATASEGGWLAGLLLLVFLMASIGYGFYEGRRVGISEGELRAAERQGAAYRAQDARIRAAIAGMPKRGPR